MDVFSQQQSIGEIGMKIHIVNRRIGRPLVFGARITINLSMMREQRDYPEEDREMHLISMSKITNSNRLLTAICQQPSLCVRLGPRNFFVWISQR